MKAREVTPGRMNPEKIGHAKVCVGPVLGLAFREEGCFLLLLRSRHDYLIVTGP